MTLDASGNLGIGETSPSTPLSSARGLVLKGSSDAQIRIQNTNTGSTSSDGFLLSIDSSASPLAYVWNYENAALIFGTNNTERARITSGGDFVVGTTSTILASKIASVAGASQNGGAFQTTASANSYTAIAGARNGNTGNVAEWWYDLSTQVGSISVTSTATAYNTSSDYRLKENIAPMTGALATVSALKPCTYTWKVDGSVGQGFIAHELQAVVPDAVHGEKDATEIRQVEVSPAVPATYDDEGNELTPAVEAVYEEREVPKYQGVDTSFLVATLTAAIQELKAELDTANTRLAALEAE